MRTRHIAPTHDTLRLPLRQARALLAALLLAAGALSLALALWISPPPGVALAAYSYICTDDPNPENTCAGGSLVDFSYCQPTCMIYAPFCVRCGSPDPVCGNGACEAGETYLSCPADCPTVCGNGACEGPGEWCGSCAQDCGACTPVCGNAWCEPSENCSTCAADCGSCPPVCGNGACEAGETSSSCPADCGSPPSTSPDSAATDEDTPVTLDVLANDSDPEGNLDPASVTVTSPPQHGGTSVDPTTGAITYTPAPDYNGSDAFVYQVCDATSLCSTGPVAITIAAVNDAPILVGDGAETSEDTPVAIAVLANDSDVDGTLDPASLTVATPPAHGSASVDPASGAITYTPDPGWSGADSFEYQICDDGGACATASVSVLVNLVNDAPTASDDSIATTVDTPVSFDPTANDSDPDGNLDACSLVVVTPPANGSVQLDASACQLTYTPDPGYTGSDTFEYEVCDAGGLCDRGTVSIAITPVGTPASPPAAPVPPAGLDPAVSKRGPGAAAVLGEAIVWMITVSNPHAQPSTPAVFSDPLPEQFDIETVLISGRATYTLSGQTLTFSVPALAPGEQVKITVHTRANALARPGQVCNRLSPEVGAEATACILLYPDRLPGTGAWGGHGLPPLLVVALSAGVIILAGGFLFRLRRRRLTPEQNPS